MALDLSRPRGELDPVPGLHDRHLDMPLAARRRLWRPAVDDPGPYQRLVANPFLGVLWCVVWVPLVAWAFRTQRLEVYAFTVASLLLVAGLVQYHCLDCGRTGLLARSRAHRCSGVVARMREGRPGLPAILSPARQTAVWVFLLFVGLMFALALQD